MRIVAISDQHGYLPDIPPCDLLVVAGDVCPDRIGVRVAMVYPEAQLAWFDLRVRPWLAAAPATHKLLTWGNHDWCGERCSFRDDAPAHARSTDLQILVDEATTVPFADGAGDLTVWATPWSNQFMEWAFMKEPQALEPVYAAIPAGIDVLVTHQPPCGYGDGAYDVRARQVVPVGSRELLAAIERVRPRVVVCGHVHGGYGRYEHAGIPIYNVSIVNERYVPVNAPTVIDLPELR
jgi:predicted thioesterase